MGFRSLTDISLVNDPKFWLGFSLIHGIGPKRITELLSTFGDLSSAWHATETELCRAGLSAELAKRVLQARKQHDLDRQMAAIKRTGAYLLTLGDENYPAQLKTLPDAPPVLYVRGTITSADNFALSIVGTRRATKYGQDASYELAREISRQGITIVSGLAHGIDTAAHRGALDAGQRTIAVLGCGIETIYPRDNRELAYKIMENGAIISEFPLGTPPEGRNFPRRNRVISGMSLGVLVVEAPDNSGAIITAGVAAEQGREVFAVPGNIYNPMSRGTNRLIQDGAKLVTQASDVLEELNIAHNMVETRTHTERIIPTNPVEAQLLKHMSVDPVHIDDLVRLCGLPTETVSSTLTILELKGLAQMVGHMQYSLVTHRH